MLGGFESVTKADIQGSKNFFAKLKLRRPPPPTPILIADCGAGIGRITKGFLGQLAGERTVVDIVEPVKKFTDELVREVKEQKEAREKEASGATGPSSLRVKLGEVYNVGLESWTPEEGRYWVIWNQWCLGHLTDAALTEYMVRCKNGIVVGGVVVVKENLTGTEDDVFDDIDSSVTRSDTKFRSIFKAAGLKIIKTELQRGLPKGLYPVRSYALQIY